MAIEYQHTFTGAAVNATTVAADIGGALVIAPGHEAGAGIVLTGAGLASRLNTGGDIAKLMSPANATVADCVVECEFFVPNNQGASDYYGIWGRQDSSVNTGYFGGFFRGSNQARLSRFVSGAEVILGTVGGLVDNTNYRFSLRLVGSTQELTIRRLSDNFYLTSAGVWQAAVAVALSAANTAISAAGRVALTLRNSVDCASADNLQLDTVGGGGGGGQAPRSNHQFRLRRAS